MCVYVRVCLCLCVGGSECVCVCARGKQAVREKRKLSQAIVTGQNNGTMPNANKPHVHAYMSTYKFSARCNRYLQR